MLQTNWLTKYKIVIALNFICHKSPNQQININPMIPLSIPDISGNEWTYVKDCLDTGWISSVGSYVTKFENLVANLQGQNMVSQL
jgi:hypothetical protein